MRFRTLAVMAASASCQSIEGSPPTVVAAHAIVRHVKLYFQALFIYVAVDVAYQLALGFRIFSHFAESSGMGAMYASPSGSAVGLMAVFFALIAFANLKLCILPAIEVRSVKAAARSGALLGATAYATLGLTNAWSIGRFPLVFALIVIVEGCVFSLVCSGLTTWLHLRRPPPQ